MIRLALPAALLLGATGALAQHAASETSPDLVEPSLTDRAVAALQGTGFRGAVAVSTAQDSIEFGAISPGAATAPDADRAWPWASVTKQVLAVLVMQQVETGALDLDAPADSYLPALASDKPSPTIRQLLQHRSGLRNPDDSPPDSTGVPSFYSDGATGIDWCLADRTSPPEEWRYNNCDYIVLGVILEKVTDSDIATLLRERIAEPAELADTRFLGPDEMRDYYGQDPSYDSRIARFGASAALVGPLEDMMRFDRALLSDKLLSAEARAILWDSDPSLGYMALGQWVFEAPLQGCEAPVKIVERRGNIGKYQVRNIILPQSDVAMALVTAEDGFDFGEIWTGAGAMHAALSAVACS